MGIVADSRVSLEGGSIADVSGFNWGAFAFTYFWGLGNGSLEKTIHILLFEIFGTLLCIIPIVGPLLYFLILLIMRIKVGINGNQWAYENRAWYNIKDFTETQKRYSAIFVAFLVLMVVAFFTGIFSAKNAPTINKYNSSNVATPAARIIGEIITAEKSGNNFKNGTDVADFVLENSSVVKMFGSNSFTSKKAPNSIRVVSKNSPQIEYFNFIFLKNGKCNLKNKNCSVTTYRRGIPATKIYYDDMGRIKEVKLVRKK